MLPRHAAGKPCFSLVLLQLGSLRGVGGQPETGTSVSLPETHTHTHTCTRMPPLPLPGALNLWPHSPTVPHHQLAHSRVLFAPCLRLRSRRKLKSEKGGLRCVPQRSLLAGVTPTPPMAPQPRLCPPGEHARRIHGHSGLWRGGGLDKRLLCTRAMPGARHVVPFSWQPTQGSGP